MEEPILKAGVVPQNKPVQLLTLNGVEAIMATQAQAVIPVTGDCLEGVGVEDGGWVAVDFTHFPAPPRYKSRGGDGSVDLCLCYAVFPGQRRPMVMCKAYDGVWGPWQMVGTRYKSMWVGDRLRMNCCMKAERIFGVIFASWDRDGELLWERDLSEFPEKLGTAPTIHGENISDPIRAAI